MKPHERGWQSGYSIDETLIIRSGEKAQYTYKSYYHYYNEHLLFVMSRI